MIFSMLTAWWRRLRRRRAFKNVIFVESMTFIPKHLGSDVYIVRRGGLDRRAVLNCPCRCGRRIDLSLVKGQEHHWLATIQHGKISLNPSIWLRVGPCRSHFFVRDSKVLWV
jgi:hypothetical protein